MAEIPENAVVVKNSKDNIKISLDRPNEKYSSGTRIGDIERKIGDMTGLETDAKGTVVAAINEVKSGALGEEDLTDYVKNTDYAKQTKGGVIKVHPGYGLKILELGTLMINKADQTMIDGKINETNPIVPANLDYAVRSVLPLTADAVPSVLAANTEYYLGETAELTFAFPTSGELGQYCFVKFVSGETAANLTVSGANFAGDIPVPKANTTYEIIATWNGTKWVSSYRGY